MSTSLHQDEIIDAVATLKAPAFSNLFPYRFYDANNCVFINTKSVMKIAEIPLLSGANEKLIKDLASLINKTIEDDIYVRIFRITDRNIDNRLSFIEKSNGELGGIFSSLAKKQTDFFKYAAVHGFDNQAGINTTLLDSRIFIELSQTCKTQSQSHLDTATRKINAVFEKIKIELHTTNIPLSFIDAENFLGVFRTFLRFNHNTLKHDFHYDEDQYLNTELTQLGIETTVNETSLLFSENGQNEHQATTYIPTKLPKSYALYNTADFLAHIDKNAAITCPHIFSIAFKVISDEKAKSTAKSKYFSLEKKANSVLTRFFPNLKDQFSEWSRIREQLERGDIRMTESYVAVTLFSEKENHEKFCSQFESTLQACPYGGFEVVRPQKIQLPLFISNFPGVIAQGLWTDLKIASLIKRRSTWNIINILPILGDWKGSYNGFVAPGMRNQLSAIDIFSDEVPTDNNNIAIAAGSGAGKSVLTQTMLFQVLASGGIVFIIDKGDSYKKLCQLLGGVYIDGKNLKLNPFTYLDRIHDKEAIQLYFSMIRDLLSTIVSPNGDLDSVSRAYLLDASFFAYAKYQKVTNIDSVVEALQALEAEQKSKNINSDSRLQDLITLLNEYTTTGINGQYFNEASRIDPNAKFVVLELGSIDANEDLVRSVLFSLINTISQRMYLSDRSQKKMCIIDEAWSLLTSDNKLASKFIEKGFRTSRKHGGSFVTITQGVTDYFRDECALACWNNSDIKIILRQNDGALKKFNDDHPNIFSSYETYVLSQFRPAKEAGFSSFMLKAGGLTTFHRLFLDPHSRILFSTHPKEFQMVFDLINKEKLNLWTAIDITARNFYGDEISKIENYFK